MRGVELASPPRAASLLDQGVRFSPVGAAIDLSGIL
jgi:hypothetical protein